MLRSGYDEVSSMDEDVAVWDRRLRVVSAEAMSGRCLNLVGGVKVPPRQLGTVE